MKVKKLRYGQTLLRKIKEEQLIHIFKKRSIINRNTVYGEVVMTSEGRLQKSGEIIPTEVSPGDIVVFEEGGHELVMHNEEELMIVPEANIIARVENK